MFPTLRAFHILTRKPRVSDLPYTAVAAFAASLGPEQQKLLVGRRRGDGMHALQQIFDGDFPETSLPSMWKNHLSTLL